MIRPLFDRVLIERTEEPPKLHLACFCLKLQESPPKAAWSRSETDASATRVMSPLTVKVGDRVFRKVRWDRN